VTARDALTGAMPGVKRAHAEDAGARVDAKRARGSAASSSHPATSTANVSVTTHPPSPVPPLPPTDELGFEAGANTRPLSAQPEPLLTQNTPYAPPNTPSYPLRPPEQPLTPPHMHPLSHRKRSS